MSLQSKRSLRKKLNDQQYRDAFVASRIAQTIAMQLRILRQREGLSQADLARELGTSQNAVSRMENPKYGKPSISTLRKMAAFFKVGLIVRFAPLSEIADWTTTLTSKSVDVPALEHDTGFVDRMPIGFEYGDFVPVSKVVGGTADLLEFAENAAGGETLPKVRDTNKVIMISSAHTGDGANASN